MDRPSFGRREFLISASAGASLLLHHVPAAGAPSTGARPRSVPLIPRGLLFADPARTWARISPDGTRIAFLAPVNTRKRRKLLKFHDRAVAPVAVR